MDARNRAWIDKYQLSGARYVWDLATATIVFEAAASRIVADVCVVGTLSKHEGSFLWSWANDAIPGRAKRGVDKVRDFGTANSLSLLTVAELQGERSQGLELVAIAGRVLEADGVWIDEEGDLTLFFALFNFRRDRPGHA